MSSNASCNNSIIDPSVCVQGAGTVGTKIAITVTQDYHGFSAGTAVRWNSGKDGVTAGYKAAQANDAYNAEVLGIVSQVLSANTFELTLSGVVRMNDFFSNTTGSIAEGFTADDVYFLSGYTAGWLDVERPTTPGWVAKPVITRFAEDINGNIFGNVTNYVGAINGGNIATSLGDIVPVGTLQAWLGQHNKVPQGWALCDGSGKTDGNGVPGINVSKYPEYNKVVGKQYGWVECHKIGNSAISVGDRVRQTISGNKEITGTVVGVSGGVEADGTKYIFLRQSINDIVLGDENTTNENFIKVEMDTTERGATDVANSEAGPEDNFNRNYTLAGAESLDEFTVSSTGFPCTIIKDDGSIEGGNALFSDPSNKVGVFSLLTPDLRERFVLGGRASDEYVDQNGNILQTRGEIGGGKRFDLGFNQNFSAFGGNIDTSDEFQANFTSQSIMPPFMTTNWIVRINPNASASIIDLLEIKDLKLTDLPTSSSGQDQFTVYVETDGTLKIVQ